jgi:hypothetical protein
LNASWVRGFSAATVAESPTDAGALLRQRGPAVVDALVRLGEDARRGDDVPRGVLRINTAMDKIMFAVQSGTSEAERDGISSRVFEALNVRARRAQNVGGRVFGYSPRSTTRSSRRSRSGSSPRRSWPLSSGRRGLG